MFTTRTTISGSGTNCCLHPLLWFWVSMGCAMVAPLVANGQRHDPKPNRASFVVSNEVRFTLLTERLVRLEWSEDRQFEDRASLVFLNRNLPVPVYTTKEERGSDGNNWLIIQTDKMQLKYKTNSGPFSRENLSIEFAINGTSSTWQPGMSDTANLFGTIRTLDGINGAAPLEKGILSRDGWTLIDDSERPLFDNGDWPWVVPGRAGKKQDWYFFGYGHEYRKQLHDFTQVAGKIPLPPRFAFGVWWSRYWNYTDEELRELVNQFRLYDVPLDVLVVDMDWHETHQVKWDWGKRDQAGQALGWTGYTWNRDYFPDPGRFLDWTEQEGLRVTLNLHPASGIQPHEERYEEMAKAMGVDPATKRYIPFEITDRKFAGNYFDIVIRPLERMGVDFWWLDWQQWHTTGIPGVTPTWWLNYVFFTDMERQKKRPLLFHRWGGLGNHRYQVGFSGDTHSTWESLAFQPYFTSTASNVGFGYWSHDIGGHQPGDIVPELYTRWVQFGALSPILRTHSAKNRSAERRIWGYPYEYFKIMRKAFLLRVALVPYLYHAAREAYDTGVSLCRPMYYDYPGAGEAYSFPGQYMFGSDLLVAPVASPIDTVSLLVEKELWLPQGNWFEWSTGTLLKGPGVIRRRFSLDQIPLYAKAGAVIPMQSPSGKADAAANPLVLTVIPGDSGSTTLYEDDGISLGYQKSEFAGTRVSHRKGIDRKHRIEIFPAEGAFEGMLMKRAYQ
ncbi:MAG: TIM-barrel domain-containing protein, partial [Bacteroidota bacterium]